MELQATIQSLRMLCMCPCGGEVLITFMSMIYDDAKCSTCGKGYTATITITAR